MANSQNSTLHKSLGTWHIMVAGVSLVVAASTLVSDFTGYFTLGSAFVVALGLAFIINLLLGLSAADMSVAYPRAGALYDYARAIFGGKGGQLLGVFLGLAMFGMSAFAISSETAAGAFGLQALLGSDLDIKYFIVVLSVLAVIPNLLGIRTTAWVSAAMLLVMLSIRWIFGLAGFAGFSNTGAWAAANLDAGGFEWFGTNGVVSAGLALAFWTFVGVEFACSLAEEVRTPRTAMPRGIVFALLAILGTSLIMGLGVTGTAPLSEWREAMTNELSAFGQAPQLAVGQLMFGKLGYTLMALASALATLSSLTVIYAAMPRLIYSIARDGKFFGPLSKPIGKLNPRFGTPVNATLITFALYLTPALYSSQVVEWLYSAAYVWIILYVVFHVLAFCRRLWHSYDRAAFHGRWFTPMPVAGAVMTLFALYHAFFGSHAAYGPRALIVLLGALGVASISLGPAILSRFKRKAKTVFTGDKERLPELVKMPAGSMPVRALAETFESN